MSNHVKLLDLSNHKGRVFFVTDVHGCFELLDKAMRDVAFNKSKDILISGGDNCDRRPKGEDIIDYLWEPWFHSIRGNHEQMLIQTYEDEFRGSSARLLYENGGEWYFDLKDKDPALADIIYQGFKELPLAIEARTYSKTIGIVHAEVPYNDWDKFKEATDAELEFNVEAKAQWQRTRYDFSLTNPVRGVDFVLVGHTPTKSRDHTWLGNVLYCDLGTPWTGECKLIEVGGINVQP